ncbi:a6 anther-specific protein [Genlisea aurea]|uniref:A6 anther-specific protein n=1 Tax=Genlisea aurea TaxID=192259 RepID=S8DDT1_9LAMI|nr:a6 anther-specific protein [Genlisea aurea]
MFVFDEVSLFPQGKCLTKDPKEPSLLSAGVEWVWATVVATVLRPFHALADKLVYGKIRSAVGISKAAVSGGGSLPPYIDTFFEGIGVTIQNGYGLTESSPVVAARLWNHNVLGSIGRPIRYTEIKVVDVETGETLPDGSRGIVKVRGPQVMKGYFKVIFS